MHISFDLDSTLITGGEEFETESRGLFAKIIGIEKIRKGAPELFAFLKNKGHIIHIYTTSYRKTWKIRSTLIYYGIKIDKVINQTQNEKTLKQLNILASKYPPAFQFDIHVDDLEGVGMEGKKYDFKTIIIQPSDTDWINTILTELNNP